MAGRGRPRKYTPRTLRKAVEAYFRYHSRTVTLREQVNTGQKDGWGHWVFELRDVTNDAGLCRHLGIHRSTWADYCDPEKHPELQEVTAYARETMEAFLEDALLTRSGKELKGVIFSLQNNYGYTERKEVELGPKARKAVTAATIPMEEREALLREMVQEFTQEREAADGPAGES